MATFAQNFLNHEQARLEDERASWKATIAEENSRDAAALSQFDQWVGEVQSGRIEDYRDMESLGEGIPKFMEVFPVAAVGLVERLGLSNKLGRSKRRILESLLGGMYKAVDKGWLASTLHYAQRVNDALGVALETCRKEEHERVERRWAPAQDLQAKLASKLQSRNRQSVGAFFSMIMGFTITAIARRIFWFTSVLLSVVLL